MVFAMQGSPRRSALVRALDERGDVALRGLLCMVTRDAAQCNAHRSNEVMLLCEDYYARQPTTPRAALNGAQRPNEVSMAARTGRTR